MLPWPRLPSLDKRARLDRTTTYDARAPVGKLPCLPPAGLDAAGLAEVQRLAADRFGDQASISLLAPDRANEPWLCEQVMAALRKGGYGKPLRTRAAVMIPLGPADAKRRLLGVLNGIGLVPRGLVPYRSEAAIIEQLGWAHDEGLVTFTNKARLASADVCRLTKFDDDPRFKDTAELFRRLRVASGAGGTVRWAGTRQLLNLRVHLRQLLAGLPSTPKEEAQRGDDFEHVDSMSRRKVHELLQASGVSEDELTQQGMCATIRRSNLRPTQHPQPTTATTACRRLIGARLCLSLNAPNPVGFTCLRSRFQVELQSSAAGAQPRPGLDHPRRAASIPRPHPDRGPLPDGDRLPPARPAGLHRQGPRVPPRGPAPGGKGRADAGEQPRLPGRGHDAGRGVGGLRGRPHVTCPPGHYTYATFVCGRM